MFVIVSNRTDLVERFELAFEGSIGITRETIRQFQRRLQGEDVDGLTVVVFDVRSLILEVGNLIDALACRRGRGSLFAVVPVRSVELAGELAHRGIDSCLPADADARSIRDFLLKHLNQFRAFHSSLKDVPEIRSFLRGGSLVMQHLRDRIRRIANTDEPVLITGETGSGKDLVAQAVHQMSPRHTGPFAPVNITAISESLFEAELFGTRKGAFTDAENSSGIIGAGHRGSVFLDEIGDLSLPLQAKLLRTIETGAVRRVGDAQTTHFSVRIISATNRDLRGRVKERQFRSDLWYRLSGLHVAVPPLRDHPEDIEELAYHILANGGQKNVQLSPRVVAWLQRYAWPGNVRELGAVVRRAVLNSDGRTIEPHHLEVDSCLDTDPVASEATATPGYRRRAAPVQGDLPGLLPD